MTTPQDDPDTDAAVVVRSRDDPRHFTLLFDRHAPTVHRFLARRAGPQVADDLLGEVFTLALAACHRYDPARADALPWLYGIAQNLLRTEHRRRARSLDAGARWASRPSAEDPYADLESRLDAGRAPVLAAVAALPPPEREVLLLVAWEELTPSQAAAALDIPAGTARSRLHRARALLRRALDPCPATTTTTTSRTATEEASA